MEQIINNQWVINIGTGLIVYIVTTFISKIILNKVTNKEKHKEVENANQEIIRILKPFVVEKNILNDKTIMCIIKSVARKYNVDFRELYDVKEICEELIREILESSYVDNDNKNEYILYLSNIIEKDMRKLECKENIELFLEKIYQKRNNKNKLYKILYLYMTFLVVIISTFVTLLSESKYESLLSMSEPMQISLLIIIVEIGILVSASYVKIRKNKKGQENSKNRTV